MNLELLKWAVLLAGAVDLFAFALMHVMITRYDMHMFWARVMSIVVVTGVVVVGLALATPARAQSITDVARCTIAANERLPAGPELRKAERECYAQLPSKVAKQAYEHRGSDERLLIVEGRLNGAGAPQRAPSYTPTTPAAAPLPALRYPYPYGPPPEYAAPYVYRTAPR